LECFERERRLEDLRGEAQVRLAVEASQVFALAVEASEVFASPASPCFCSCCPLLNLAFRCVCVCLCVCARACVAWSVRVCGVSMLMHMSEESVWMHISGLDRASRQAGRCRTGAACTGAACTGAACTGAACFGACQAGTRVSTRCSSMAWARGSIKSVCTLRPSDISRHRRRAGVSMGSIGAWQDGCWAGGGATGM
jgi:hypothetical protein